MNNFHAFQSYLLFVLITLVDLHTQLESLWLFVVFKCNRIVRLGRACVWWTRLQIKVRHVTEFFRMLASNLIIKLVTFHMLVSPIIPLNLLLPLALALFQPQLLPHPLSQNQKPLGRRIINHGADRSC
jgi:hypothetical protein